MKKKTKLAALGAAGLVGLYFFTENKRLEISRYKVTLPSLRQSKCRMLILSDFHNVRKGGSCRRLIAKIERLEPDCILIPGDLLVKQHEDVSPALYLLEQLRKIGAPVYYSVGNHEGSYADAFPEMFAEYRKRVEALGVVYLDNAIADSGFGFFVAGLTVPKECYRKGRKSRVLTADDIREALGECPEHCVLLAHNPADFPAYAAWGAEMTVSGHMHGGVVRIPWWDRERRRVRFHGTISPQWKLFPTYDGGYFTIEAAGSCRKHSLFVSRGLGTHTLKLRFCNVPELVVIDAASDEEQPVLRTANRNEE